MPNSCKKSESCGSTSSTPRRGRKRGRQSVDSELSENNSFDDVKEIDRRLKKVAKESSTSSVRSVVRNEHVLALVTLKGEDDVAKQKVEQERRSAIIITDTPSVPKLTRAKARELNCTPNITLPPLNETPTDGLEALISQDLQSDEEDEEYTFKEDDFHSDDEGNTTASDFDSNPNTPQTPLAAMEESPVKFTADGCFKVPFDPPGNLAIGEDHRIATRTRSKLCLQQTTIEDLQSEFVPPDVEQSDILEYEMTANDTEWMQFLNDFNKPLSNSFVGDDDDPINDPEYVANDNVDAEYTDAEELRDANISKKELTDLVSELFAGLLQEGISLDSIELGTPQKFLEEADSKTMPCAMLQENMPLEIQPLVQVNPNPIDQVTRQIDFDNPAATMMTSTCSELESFQPNVMSTPSSNNRMLLPVPVADTSITNSINPGQIINISTNDLGQPPELIAVPLPGQPNCFQLAKVIATGGPCPREEYIAQEAQDYQQPVAPLDQTNGKSSPGRYTKPYDTNFTYEYISVRKHIYSEYEEEFENLKHMPPPPVEPPSNLMGFTQDQHDILQQQLRIHTQLLAQNFLQTYSHPTLYHLAKKPKEMLEELHRKSSKDASFQAWNLPGAIELIHKWEQDLNDDAYQEENTKMMEFINKEADLTDGNARQVPRLAPRIMNLMLDSTVFMYPQYLPRMAFQPRIVAFTAYAPTEYQLIAMGLEKHIGAIRAAKKPLRKKADPVRVSCMRIAKDMIHGKEGRRVFFKVNELRAMEQYNPVKYYFDYGRAPPIKHVLLGFHNGQVQTPRERYQELPSGWKFYLQKKWTTARAKRTTKPPQVSSLASESYLEFVREAVGEDLLLPESLGEATIPAPADGSATESREKQAKEATLATAKTSSTRTKSKRRSNPSSLTINVNYVFGGGTTVLGAGADIGGVGLGAGVSVPFQSSGSLADNVLTINRCLDNASNCSLLALPPPPPPLDADAPPAINFRFDPDSQALQITELEEPNAVEFEEAATLLPASISSTTNDSHKSAKDCRFCIFKPKIQGRRRRRGDKVSQRRRRSRLYNLRQRRRQKFQKRCQALIHSYLDYLQNKLSIHARSQSVQVYYRHFVALELYTHLLVDLKMFCRTKVQSTQQKRPRIDEETARNRKANRQEEMLRHMLQPDSRNEANRKDAIFAHNFYDKVEEALLNADRLDDCQKFNKLLQNFDPKKDKVADLYLKVEKLLLPDLPELAEVFLNFLLPAEAAELGKFFEHFMITNAHNFINKLNIYFCKQPAQIRKIYACLSELAELPSVSMKKVENRIMPLLKGNQFLIDWFVQQFPQAKPPKRILPPVETVNMHEVQNNTTGEFTEMVIDLLDAPLAPTKDKTPACQLRYINGRIFYGSKILLPAKLSFMAASIYNEQNHDDMPSMASGPTACIHGIRTQGEKLIGMALSADSDDNEDEASRSLVIDTTGDEDNSCSSIEMCDELGLRAHAFRLNASLYGSQNMGNATTSTPNVGHHSQHHPNAKKTAIHFGETSPRRQTGCGVSPLPPLGGHNISQNEKRKSPNKKVKSPLTRPRYNLTPMVVIHESQQQQQQTIQPQPAVISPAIECAKRLRSLIDQDNVREDVDSKASISIIAQAKQTARTPTPTTCKIEMDTQDEDQEFLPESPRGNASISISLPLSQQSFPAIVMDETDLEAPLEVSSGGNTPQHVITTQFDSDEDNKLDVVATLANFTQEEGPLVAQQGSTLKRESSPAGTSASAASTTKNLSSNSNNNNSSASPTVAWTREEDKIILIEMKIGARDRDHLIKRMSSKLKHRNETELRARHQFLIDFLSKLQGK
ncbi:uncharacterized protein LOC6640489 [Drosophila willistoni]|nr:uncharacterized protein LOC6640489 [Drosophila willistoni]